jgi:uncharacterized membrane protein YcaP (DUF421 family)
MTMISALWSHQAAHDVFALGAPLAEKVLRPALVYLSLVVLLRIFGKRELAQLNPFDLVVLLSLSNTVQNAMIGNDNSLTGGLVGAFTLLLINYLVVRFLFRHRRLDEVFQGAPTVLIEHGRLKPEALAAELLTPAEILTVAHRQGFASLDEIERCVLEPGGTFFIQARQPRAHDRRQAELLARLDQLSRQVEALRHDRAGHAGA